MNSDQRNLLQLLDERLERLNVDSKWARRASGTRGGVLRALEQIQQGKPPSRDVINILISRSMDILTKAAKEIPDTATPDGRNPPES
jgi:hypothetical protein